MTTNNEQQATNMEAESLLSREWLVTNGLGGYASGSLAGVATRRYHGLLVAALPVPYGRTVMFSHLIEELRFGERPPIQLGGEELTPGAPEIFGAHYLKEFRLELGVPVWRYEIDGMILEKRILMPFQQNTVMIDYRLRAGGENLRIHLRPSFHFLPHDAPVSERLDAPYDVTATGDHYEVYPPGHLPPVANEALRRGRRPGAGWRRVP